MNQVKEMDLIPGDNDLLSYFLSASTVPHNNNTLHETILNESNLAELKLAPAQVDIPSSITNENVKDNASTGPLEIENILEQMHRKSPKQKTTSIFVSKSEASEDEQEKKNENKSLESTNEKRQKRLERNRESARQSRRRKKQYLELLEEKVVQLTEEIDETRRKHLDSAHLTLAALKKKLISSLYQQIESNDTVLQNGLNLIHERFSPNSEENLAIVDYNFRQLNDLLLPPYTKFLFWLSIQDDDFFTRPEELKAKGNTRGGDSQSDSDLSSLWTRVTDDLGITLEQEEKIKLQYQSQETKATRMQRRRIAVATTYLDRLRQSINQRAENISKHVENIQDILTPQQSIKYLKWMEENGHRLEKISMDSQVSVPCQENDQKDEKLDEILRKPDHELGVEDISVLLAALSPQKARSS